MPGWIIFLLVVGAYALIAGTTLRTTQSIGRRDCDSGWHDHDCSHWWFELFGSMLWPAGIPLYIGLWMASRLRLGMTKAERQEARHEREMEATNQRIELAAARERASIAERRALAAEIEVTNDRLAHLRPEMERVPTDDLR